MTAKKSDGNQSQIVETLRDLGMFVFSLHEVGRGCPDILCAYRGQWLLAEVKNGKRGKLNDAQKEFHTLCGAPVTILTSVGDAIEWTKAIGVRVK